MSRTPHLMDPTEITKTSLILQGHAHRGGSVWLDLMPRHSGMLPAHSYMEGDTILIIVEQGDGY